MSRSKLERNITFKPSFTQYVPKAITPNGTVSLLPEEMEALYLMDHKGCYQENAAQSMNVSRPTFTRILKSARSKLTNALIGGYTIQIETGIDFLVFAVCADDESLEDISFDKKYIFIYKSQNDKTILVKRENNPVYEKGEKPALAIPKLLQENQVHQFISSKIGIGLKNTLTSNGIKPIVLQNFDLDSFVKQNN